MSIATSLIGGIAGGLGGALSAGSERRANQRAGAAAAWDPTNLSGAGGLVNWSGTGAAGNPYTANVTGDATTTQLLNLFSGRAMDSLSGMGPTNGFQNWAAGLGNGGIQDIFSNALNQAGNLPLNDFVQSQGALQNLFGQAGAATNAITGQLNNLNTTDYNGITNNMLANLRAQVAPQQQQQFDMFQNSAFSKGQLGTTGGAQNLQAFLNAQNQQDLGLQTAANQFGQSLLNQNQQYGLGLMGQQGGLFGLQGNLAQNYMGNANTMYGLQNAAGQQGLQNVMSLFGAGSQLGTQDITNAMNLLQGNLGINQSLQNLLQLSNNSSTSQAAAGANQARYLANTGQNALGSFFTGFGTAMGGAPSGTTMKSLFGG